MIKIYAHILKYLRISKISAPAQNICAHLEISAHIQNICSHLKYLRISEISAHIQNICASLKYMRLIIYDSNKADVEISAPMKNICALKSSRSVDVVSPPCSPQVKSAPRPPSLYGRRLSCTVLAVVLARPAKISASCPNICSRIHFHLFLGKNKKPNSAHKCPITSIQIRI